MAEFMRKKWKKQEEQMFVICLYFLQGMWYNFIGLPGSQLKEYDAADSETLHGYRDRHMAYRAGHLWKNLSDEQYLEKDWGSCLLRERWPRRIRQRPAC